MKHINKSYEENIKNLKQLAFDSWKGTTGEQRSEEIEKFVRNLTKNYSEVLGLPEEDILNALEAARDYSEVNYYQKCNFPDLNKDIDVFNTKDDFFNKFPSRKFQCSACDSISTDPNTCNSGKLVDRKICDWKSYGLFGTMGKGYNFIIKDGFLKNARVYEIFKPVELTT